MDSVAGASIFKERATFFFLVTEAKRRSRKRKPREKEHEWGRDDLITYNSSLCPRDTTG